MKFNFKSTILVIFATSLLIFGISLLSYAISSDTWLPYLFGTISIAGFMFCVFIIVYVISVQTSMLLLNVFENENEDILREKNNSMPCESNHK